MLRDFIAAYLKSNGWPDPQAVDQVHGPWWTGENFEDTVREHILVGE